MLLLCSVNQICSRPRIPSVGLPRFRANAAHAGGGASRSAAMITLTDVEKIRFWSKIERRGIDECWPWMAKSKANGGYGYFKTVANGMQRAHRIAFQLIKGEIPTGLCVCHHCDNPPCCNPRHLFLGTIADNTHDMMNKGRRVPPTYHTGKDHWISKYPEKICVGESHGGSKLTTQQVLEIRELGSRGIAILAISRTGRFPVSRQCIQNIIERKVWKHL